MNILNKDELFRLAVELDLPSLLRFCQSYKAMNDKVCKNNNIWLYKLKNEFPDYHKLNVENKSLREIYTLLYNLNILKQKLYRVETIYELYDLKQLDLANRQLREVPKELGYLHNLQKLWLSRNQLKEIPKELGNLHNLQKLYLGNNQLQEIPKELGNLHNLQELFLENNPLKEIPKELNRKYLHIYKQVGKNTVMYNF